ncbi:hypothetical protein Golomagni_06171 [Golovinomyces magnicellulatus]|nr:hypothetical protein Golomagni_06171 [Golovinomyces magnicellulatus]
MESCCTCATVINDTNKEQHDKKAYSGPSLGRRLGCCTRVMCGDCLHENPRFEAYCPYCQISSEPTSLPPGLKEPPSYLSSNRQSKVDTLPPPYSSTAVHNSGLNLPKNASSGYDEKQIIEDTLHFLDHEHDSIASLSLRYGVPASALRQKNNIASDHLLAGRKTILIPGDHYRGGVSLSPRPVEGEDEERRKRKIRTFMTTCKVSDYDIALLYLEQSKYDLDASIEAHFADEAWERANPQRQLAGKKHGLASARRRSGH